MIDWSELFGLSVHPAELIARGTAMYIFLFLMFRFVVRRDVGAIGIGDVLLLVIVADAAQNAMAGEYTSVTDGCILVATLMFWNVAIDFLSFRFPRFRRFAEPAVLLLIKNGEMQRRNLRREFISPDELMSQLREQGIDKLAQVKRCYMESSGTVSVIKYKDDGDKPDAAHGPKIAGT